MLFDLQSDRIDLRSRWRAGNISKCSKKILELKRIVEFRENNFQPSQSPQNFRRDFSSQLAQRRPRITLELSSCAYGEALEVLPAGNCSEFPSASQHVKRASQRFAAPFSIVSQYVGAQRFPGAPAARFAALRSAV